MAIKYAVIQCVALWLASSALVHARPSTFGKAGDPCKPRTIFCADGDGQSSRYLKCIRGRLVEDSCANNSICVGSKDTTVFCAIEDTESEKATTVTVQVLHHSAQATRSRPAALLPPPPPTHAATERPPLLLMHTSKPSPESVPVHGPVAASAQWSSPQQPQSQPPNHLALSAAPRPTPPQHALLPPALNSQVSSYIRPSVALSHAQLQPHAQPQPQPQVQVQAHPQPQPPALHVPPTSAGPSQAAASVYMLNHSPNPMFAASQAPLGDAEDAEDDSPNVAGDIDGVAVDDALSVIGNAIFSQHPELLSRPAATEPDLEPTPQEIGTAMELPATRQPQRPTVARGGFGTCTPGNFVCEAHGLRPGYFACDSSGLALPASCGPTDVCYQHRQVIVCGAPGRNF